MKVRIVNRPTGLLNGRDWPVVGEEMELPDDVAHGMADVGHVELVEEKKPAAKKAAAKKPETRPAADGNVETRKD